MKRPLFTIGVVYFLAAATAIFLGASAALAAGALSLFWAGLALLLFKRDKVWTLVICLLTCSAAFVLFFACDTLYLSPLVLEKGTQLPLEGRVLSVELREWGAKLEIEGSIAPVYPEPVRLTLAVFDTGIEPQAGQKITGVVKVRESYGFTRDRFHLSKGEVLFCYPDSRLYFRDDPEGMTLFQKMMVLRQRLLDGCDQLAVEDTAALMKGVLLGETGDFPSELNEDLADSGLRHLTAVSGFHITLLTGLMLSLGRIFSLPPRRTAGMIMAVLPFLAMAQGLTPSVIRACFMAAMMCAAQLLGRQYDSLNALGLSVLIILLPNPMAAVNPSFLLSFGSILGILLFSDKLFYVLTELEVVARLNKGKPWKQQLLLGSLQLFSVSATAQVFTIPLQIYYFGKLTPFGILATMLASLIFPCMMVLGYGVLGLSFLPWQEPAAFVMMGVKIFFHLFQRLAKIFAHLPSLEFAPGQVYIWLLLPAFYLCGWLIRKRKDWYLPAIFLAFLLLLGGEVWWRFNDSRLLHVVDVNQGEAVFLSQDGRGAVIGDLSDEYAANKVIALMKANQVEELVFLAVTRSSCNNSYGTFLLCERYAPKFVLAPEEGRYRPFLEKSVGARLSTLSAPVKLSFGGGEILLSPTEEGTEVEIHAGGKKILKTADSCVIIKEMSLGEIYLLPEGEFFSKEELRLLPDDQPHLILATGGKSP